MPLVQYLCKYQHLQYTIYACSCKFIPKPDRDTTLSCAAVSANSAPCFPDGIYNARALEGHNLNSHDDSSANWRQLENCPVATCYALPPCQPVYTPPYANGHKWIAQRNLAIPAQSVNAPT